MPKYIFVTGGVLSGLGKGIAGASIGHILSDKYTIVPIKCDGYLNTDPGTMNPAEHGEVFVLDDGTEVDMDFGHYERFLNYNCTKDQSLTMGKVFAAIQKKERNGDYLGKTVQFIPHVTDYIKEHFQSVAEKTQADVVLIEIGGTVGDIENELFIEAARQLTLDLPEKDSTFIHLTYVPFLDAVKEQKSKPTQISVRQLLERGIKPDIIIARSHHKLDSNIKRKIGVFCNVHDNAVISGHDVSSVYQIPELFYKQGILELIEKELALNVADLKCNRWNSFLPQDQCLVHDIKIAICGKYTTLEDSYASILEALKHCTAHTNARITIEMIETTDIQTVDDVASHLKECDGVIIPGGFGNRGTEGKIKVIQYCRENNIPFLGICLGLQLAVVEFARNVCNISNASSEEFTPESSDNVITYLPGQDNTLAKGGTMRLGSYEAHLAKGSKVQTLYGSTIVHERHRHRYEVNPTYHATLTKHGLNLAGMSPDKKLVEFICIEEHPFFMATQAHPELKSKLENPAPLFLGLINAALRLKK